MKVSKRRSHIEIIANMLKVGENGAGKTEIMYSANMSYSQIQKYLGFLIGQGFIDKIKIGNPCVTYQVTDKGLKLLQTINSALEMLGISEDDEL
jgi:predicted transcriptional regulator